MKGIFLTYNQAYYMELADAFLKEFGVRGYTMWQEITGRGSEGGEPHEGSHAWPAMNNAMFVAVEDEKVEPILKYVQKRDVDTPGLGLRAFVWNIEEMY